MSIVNKISLNIIESIPAPLHNCEATELADFLPGPSLIHIEGTRPEPIFISVLLHGNETVGLKAIQNILNNYPDGLPRAISLFIGNIAAARIGERRLDQQPDYNRIWPSPANKIQTPEHEMMREVCAEMKARQPFVSIDLHNNTGLNPHYACINKLDHKFFHLATLFSRTVVYFLRPFGVQSMAFSDICPAVTLECGRIGDKSGISHATEFIDACLHINQLPEHKIRHEDINLFHTVATVKVPEQFSFGFGDTPVDINFADDLEYFNFRELPAGTLLGYYHKDKRPHLHIVDENDEAVEQRFLIYENGEIRLSTEIMPSMLTLNERVIRQDCLCYFLERYQI
jgi:succinylglutamate desuccinylase